MWFVVTFFAFFLCAGQIRAAKSQEKPWDLISVFVALAFWAVFLVFVWFQPVLIYFAYVVFPLIAGSMGSALIGLFICLHKRRRAAHEQ